MRTIFFTVLLLPSWGFATETINCYFDKFHQVNHEAPEMSGYSDINQSCEIWAGKTTQKTLKLDGQKRAVNSKSWILLEPKGWEMNSTTYAGDFGELLTIEHELGENKKGLDGWYKASLVSSNITATYTSLGMCLIK